MTSSSTSASPITVYGASWCPDCRRAKQFLASHRIPYKWVDLEAEPDQVVEVESRNNGKRIIPTIVFADGSFLAEPSNDELADRIGLSRAALLDSYDLVIIGGGPTGLTTAIYAARENAKVLIVEKSAPGGQAAITERFDNYPGFPDGVGGAELAERMTRQAERYGVEILQAVGATKVSREEPMIRVDLSTGDHVLAPAALIATGSTYRRTDAEGEADLIGAGIHFCATCDGPFYKGSDNLTIVGGGNAAIDSARTVLRMGSSATILYRRERKDMPAIDEEIQAAEDEGVRFVFLAAPHRILGGADGSVKAIEIVKTRLGEYDKSGRRRPMPTDEVQRFECDSVILAVGETFDQDFCRASGLELKEEGTIIVDRFTYETSRPNFYAGGDVITGASNVSNAMSCGKQAAQKMDERLMGEQRWERIFPDFEYSRTAPGEPSLSRRHAAHDLPAALRVRSQQEVVAGLDPKEALEECRRCLRCDLRATVTAN